MSRSLAGAPGILKVVKLDNAVAVVATGSYWRAKQALARLQPEWDVGEAGKRRQRAAFEGVPCRARASRC